MTVVERGPVDEARYDDNEVGMSVKDKASIGSRLVIEVSRWSRMRSSGIDKVDEVARWPMVQVK